MPRQANKRIRKAPKLEAPESVGPFLKLDKAAEQTFVYDWSTQQTLQEFVQEHGLLKTTPS